MILMPLFAVGNVNEGGGSCHNVFLRAIKTPPRAIEFRSLRKIWYSGVKISLVKPRFSAEDAIRLVLIF